MPFKEHAPTPQQAALADMCDVYNLRAISESYEGAKLDKHGQEFSLCALFLIFIVGLTVSGNRYILSASRSPPGRLNIQKII